MMPLPREGTCLGRIEALWVTADPRDFNSRLDIYYVKKPKHVPPLLRKLVEEGFIPYFEWVRKVRSEDREHGFGAVGDVG